MWGNTGTNFNTGTSWSGGTAPGISDVAVFSSAVITQPNLSGALTIQELNFSVAAASGYDLTSSNTGVKLTLTNTGTGATSAINAANTSGTNTIDAPIILGAAAGSTQTFTQANGGTLVVNGVISSTNSVTLSLTGGIITLAGSNTYSGGTTLAASTTLRINNASALGTGTFTINGGTIDNTSAGAITLTNNNAQAWNGDFTFTGTKDLNLGIGAVTMNASRIITVNGGTLTVGGAISGATFGIIKAGTGALTLNGVVGTTSGTITINSNGGTLTLAGNNTYTGGTTLNSGSTLNINAAGTSSTNSAIGTGTLTINGGTIDNTSAGAITLATIYRSAGRVPESFLRGTQQDIPEDMLATLRDASTKMPIEYRSCFVSYASKDSEFVDHLTQRLRRARVSLWRDQSSLRSGEPFADRIFESISRYDRFVVVLSKHAVKSKWVAKELELGFPDAPWHSHRDRLATLVCACGVLTGALGKMARDISLLMQSEVGEAAEPSGPGRGGSSTMPHKRNPSGCLVTLAASNRVPGLVATFLSAMVQEHERAAGSWQAEWPTVAALIQATGVAAASMAEVAEGLSVDRARMRANLDATRAVIFAERAMMLLGEKLGRDVAFKLLDQATRQSVIQGRRLHEALAEIPEVSRHLDRETLKKIETPEEYLGSSEVFRKRLLSDAADADDEKE